jgi:hypothetical protein
MTNTRVNGYEEVSHENAFVIRSSAFASVEEFSGRAPEIDIPKYVGRTGLVGLVRRSAGLVIARTDPREDNHSKLDHSKAMLHGTYDALSSHLIVDNRQLIVRGLVGDRFTDDHPFLAIGSLDVKREVDPHWVDPDPQLLPLADWQERFGMDAYELLDRRPEMALTISVYVDVASNL